MISNSELFFVKAKAYQDRRTALNNDLQDSLKKLKRFEGSAGYAEDVKKAKDKYSADLEKLQAEYSPQFSNILNGMADCIAKRPAKAPTAEQISLLNLLKMKKKPSASDLDQTANAVIDCPMALSIIDEVARENGLRGGYARMCPIMDNESALAAVEGLRDGVEDFLKYDSSRASRVAQRYYRINQGIELETTPRRTFAEKSECFGIIGGLNEEQTAQFCGVVDND